MVRVRVVVLALAAALAAVPPARTENVVRRASATSGMTFDPHAFYHNSTIAQNLQVYQPLVDIDSDHRIKPALAVSWRLLDPLTWEFTLREGVRFHDGAPLTAADVVFSLRRALSLGSEFALDVPPVPAVEAADDRVVRVTNRSPNLVV